MASITTKEAFKALNGVFCVYKPGDRTIGGVIVALKTALTKDINSLPFPARPRLVFEEQKDSDLPVITTVPDLAQHPLVLGPRFEPEDFYIQPSDRPMPFASGVLVFGINGGISKLRMFSTLSHVKVYHVHGQFGRTTHNHLPTGRLIQKTTYRHITQAHLDRILAAIQASHQKHIYNAAGVHLQSQKAYELATRGLLRARVGPKAGPVIYGIKCIHFDSPNFILEVHISNEYGSYMTQLVQSMALQLKSSAICTKLHRIRVGPFSLPHALLQKHWRVESIAENITVCAPLVSKEMLKQESNLQELSALVETTS